MDKNIEEFLTQARNDGFEITEEVLFKAMIYGFICSKYEPERKDGEGK